MVRKILANNLYFSLIGLLIKNGKKTKAQKVVNNSLLNCAKTTNLSIPAILNLIFKKILVFTEIKTIKQRKKTTIIPKMLSGNRRLHVSTRLLLASVNDNSSRKSVEKKLTDELLSLIKGTKSKTYLKKVENEKIALKNKSNAHYRW